MIAKIVVPWRGGDPVRESLWQFARNWWERLGLEIIVSHHDGPEPFNRSKALNDGARQAWPWDVIACIDADVVEDNECQVTTAISQAWQTGKFLVAHTEGKDLNEQATHWLLDGKKNFDWHRYTNAVRPRCLSRVNVMRADLFEQLGGWDERFVGWGSEDVAIYAAAEALSGPLLQVPGSSWHLFHPPMLPVARPTPQWQAGKALAARYLDAAKNGPQAVQSILDERSADERYDPPFPAPMPEPVKARVELVVITSGRREYLEQTLASAAEHLHGDIAQRTMFDDSGDPAFGEYLDKTYGYFAKPYQFSIIHHDQKLGYSVTMRKAREHIRDTQGPPYVFWLEDDFVFNRDISLDEMATLLTEPDLAQVVLLRQPWKAEVAAGGIIQQHPESYTYAVHRGIRYLRHQRFFSANPHLARRELFSHTWPEGAHTESRFGKELVAEGLSFAFLGWGEPDVLHIGEVRGGDGY